MNSIHSAIILVRSAWPIVAIAAALTSAGAFAAEDPPLIVGPEEKPPAAGPADSADLAALRALAAETVAAMQQARTGFADGVVNQESESLQSGILERLERLADLARRQSQMTTAGRSTPAAGRGAQASNAGDGQGAAGRSPDAAESSEAATGPATADGAAATTTRDLATSVWGHLPARQRDRMQSRFSEQFLPQYEQLVRKYYEALATDGLPNE